MPGEDAAANRAAWGKLTAGEELARGKAVQFFPKPGYRLTTDEHDSLDLTDGKLSSRPDDRIWFGKDAVGWLGVGMGGGVLLRVDLGTPQPVGQIAVRILGGHEQGSLLLPNAVEFLASVDGEHYFSLQRMTQLQPAERAQSDFQTAFYLPEEGKAYMAPFVCRQPVRARYVALRIYPVAGLFIDELSILKADAAASVATLPGRYRETPVYTDGVVVRPKAMPFTVTTNLVTPNWVNIENFAEQEENKTTNVGFRLELPPGFELLPATKLAFQELPATSSGGRRYEFSNLKSRGPNGAVSGPLYLTKSADAPGEAGGEVTLTGLLDGQASHVLHFPLHAVEIPIVPPLPDLEISLAWMHDSDEHQWPQFLENFHKLGFNFVSTFPRYFSRGADSAWNTQKSLSFLEEARRLGYRVIYNESAFHVMYNQIEARQKAGKLGPEEAAEIFNQVQGKPGKWESPLYRGPYFQDEIHRIADLAALVRPDHVYFDIERYDPVIAEAKNDPRVAAAWKKSGKSWDEFTTDVGEDILATLVRAVRQAVPERKMKFGLYNCDPGRAHERFFSWPKLYPQVLDLAMPSIYVQGRTPEVIARIETDYRTLQARQIIPWLTAGTYGEFPPELMEPMVLETILGGAGGFSYFAFEDFDPMDYYYHAKALSTLARFPDLLHTGKPKSYRGDNPNLHYTAFASSTEVLLLIGNYGRSLKDQVRLPVNPPFKASLIGAASAPSDLPVTGKVVALQVPAGEFRLIHLHP